MPILANVWQIIFRVFRPKKEIEDKKTVELKSFSYAKLYCYATWVDYFLITFGSISSIVTAILTPYFIKLFGQVTGNIIEFAETKAKFNVTADEKEIAEEKMMKEILNFTIHTYILGFIIIILTYISIVLITHSATRLISKIRSSYVHAMLNKDISWYDSNQIGDFSSRVTEDMNKIEEALGDKSITFLYCIFIFVTCLSTAFMTAWKLTLICLMCLPGISITIAVMTWMSRKLVMNEIDAYGKAGAIAEEAFNSIRTVVAFGGQNKEIERYNSSLCIAEKNNIKRAFITGVSNGFMWLFVYVSYAVTFYYGIILIVDERSLPKNERIYTAANLIIICFNVLEGTLYIAQCQQFFEIFALAKGASNKIFSIIEDQPKINLNKNNGQTFSYLKGKICFENVYFDYPSRPDVKILQGLSFTVNAGETVALVGSSGCGKSTCIQLIQRFYDALKGCIVIDGKEIIDFDLAWLRNQIGVVGQEPILFGTTIRENIRYGNFEAKEEDILEAAKKANAHTFINKLPKRYDTLVGEQGTQLSGGQKQRIAIARALVRNPSILLLDEATSALDTSSEAQVQEALDDASKERTTIIVAHRLSTIRHADKIFMMSKGRIAEEGSHEELMNNKGPYFNLVTSQVSKESNRKEGKVTKAGTENVAPESMESKLDDFYGNSNEKKDEELLNNSQISTFQTIKEMLKMNKPEYRQIILGCIGAAGTGCFSPICGVIFGNIIGILSNPHNDFVKSEGHKLSLGLLIVAVLIPISSFFQWYQFGKSGEKLTTRVRGKMFETMLKQEIGWFDRKENGTGAICSRLSEDASCIQGASGQSLGILFNSLCSFGAGMAMSFYFEWKLTLVHLFFIPFIFVGNYFEKRFLSKVSSSSSQSVEESSKLAVEAISNIRTVASLGCETKFHSMYVNIIDGHRSKCNGALHIRGLVLGMARSLVCLANASSIYYGGYLIIHEALDYAIIFKILAIVMGSSSAVVNTLTYSPNFQKGIHASSKILNFFKRTPTIADKDIAHNLKWNNGVINYKEINFSYPTRREIKVLDNFDLTVQHGKTVALVGPSGCGKSTIIQLLERFYDPHSGRIFIDNQNIKSVKLLSLRQQLGIVSQEPNLFDRTIAENIAYGDNNRCVSENEIIQAAKNANIHSFISSLPLGYETRLGEKGTQLSGGQKQRIAIARALVRNPQILLLDEATSALDTESEKIVQEALDKAKSGRTCITIAHRLQTIQNADIICVINNGNIAEKGTHEELLKLNGIYSDLCNLQNRQKNE